MSGLDFCREQCIMSPSATQSNRIDLLTPAAQNRRFELMEDTPIAVGQPAPDFSLPASVGPSPLSLSSLRGKTVVLAFYVLDFTEV
jgi:hypothetical protein